VSDVITAADTSWQTRSKRNGIIALVVAASAGTCVISVARAGGDLLAESFKEGPESIGVTAYATGSLISFLTSRLVVTTVDIDIDITGIMIRISQTSSV